MTDSPATRVSTAALRARATVVSVLDTTLQVTAVGAAIAVLGAVAVMTGHTGTAVLMVLALQMLILAVVVHTSRRSAAAHEAVAQRLNHSDARIAGDIARLRLTLSATDTNSKDQS